MSAVDSFRRLPVDLYSEDYVSPSSLLPVPLHSPSDLLNLATTKLSTVRQLLQRGDTAGALKSALQDPPFGEQEADQAKDKAREAVALVLNGTRSTEVGDLVKGLTGEELVVLMKYLYKSFETLGDNQNGNVVLGWHEKVVEQAGTGVIVRVMCDRRLI